MLNETNILNFIISLSILFLILLPYISKFLFLLKSKDQFKNLGVSSRLRIIYELNDAVQHLSENKIGALITICKRDSIADKRTDGVFIDCKVSSSIILTIFNNKSPLHDGAIIIEQDRIKYASTYYKISNKSSKKGSRHRAALGISEMSDSVTIVVSEETGSISFAHKGKLLETKNNDFSENLDKLLLN